MLALRVLVGMFVMVAVGVTVGVIAGFNSPIFMVEELAAIGGMLLQDRLATPIVDRWDRGATGEEHVGGILDGLAERGWRSLHDGDTGRGDIDHVVVVPGGLFSLETKSHRGRIAVDWLDGRMLRQAYV